MNAKNFLFFVVMFFSGLGANAQNKFQDLNLTVSDSFRNQIKVSFLEYTGGSDDSLSYYFNSLEKMSISHIDMEKIKKQIPVDSIGSHDNFYYIVKEGNGFVRVRLFFSQRTKKFTRSYGEKIEDIKNPHPGKTFTPIPMECKCRYFLIAPDQEQVN